MNQIARKIKENIGKVIVGKEEQVDLILTALLSGGHVLLEDVPGTGKTVLSKALAKSISCEFSRIQFTPDLLPSDVTGLNFFHQKQNEFVFREGPVFTNILLADEINRATPRTQSALLECMAERQVTVDGETRALPEPYFVIATENPVETTGTFPLPEAQLDRFLMKLSMGTPTKEEEVRILSRFLSGAPMEELNSVCSDAEIRTCMKEAKETFIHPILIDYIASLSEASRNEPHVLSGISPRGSIALATAAKAYAYIQGRDFVTPEDIKHLAVPVLSHRLILDRAGGRQDYGKTVTESLLNTVPLPTEKWSR